MDISYSADVPCPCPHLSSELSSYGCDLVIPMFLSRYVICLLFASLFFAWVVSAYVSASCVIAGSTHKF